MTDDSAARTPLSRRTLLGAAAWSVPVIAVTAAAPAQAASLPFIDADGVALTFTDIGPDGGQSSTFRLSGQIAFSAPAASATTVSATITWRGTGANSGATGLYLYSAVPASNSGQIIGWVLVVGQADDTRHETYVFQTTLAAGAAQATTVSSYDGDPDQGFMYGVETPNGNSTPFYDGIITIRFSAPGYSDAVLEVSFPPAQPD